MYAETNFSFGDVYYVVSDFGSFYKYMYVIQVLQLNIWEVIYCDINDLVGKLYLIYIFHSIYSSVLAMEISMA